MRTQDTTYSRDTLNLQPFRRRCTETLSAANNGVPGGYKAASLLRVLPRLANPTRDNLIKEQRNLPGARCPVHRRCSSLTSGYRARTCILDESNRIGWNRVETKDFRFAVYDAGSRRKGNQREGRRRRRRVERRERSGYDGRENW